VFSSGFEYFDDFDTNTLSDYEIYEGTAIDDSDFSIANSELQQADTNSFYFIGYDVSGESLSSFFLEYEISSYADNDFFGGGFVIGGNTIVGHNYRKEGNELGLGEKTFPDSDLYRFLAPSSPSNHKVISTSLSYTEPFTQRLEFDGTNVELFHNSSSVTTHSVNATGSISLIGLISSFNNPGMHWDSIEIGSL
jgi:hypothetical protein